MVSVIPSKVQDNPYQPDQKAKTPDLVELLLDDPWWTKAKASTEEEARDFCRKMGTGQCAAICLSHMSSTTSDGRCPEALRVWSRK
jgi:hypothetical protein